MELSEKQIDHWIEENCKLCGTQRCDPYNDEWREGCYKWQSFIGRWERKAVLVNNQWLQNRYGKICNNKNYVCPNCLSEVSVKTKPNFCGECGQKLDWNETNSEN